MNDSAVGPAGLFDLDRQRRVLAALKRRLVAGDEQRQRMLDAQAAEERAESARAQDVLAECRQRCSRWRRDALQAWDDAEEAVVLRYETDTIAARDQWEQELAEQRRQAQASAKRVEAEAAAATQQTLAEYQANRPKPDAAKREAHRRVAGALRPLKQSVDAVRELVVRRLDHLPDVAPPEDSGADGWTSPVSIDDAIGAIGALHEQVRACDQELRSGTAVALVDSYRIPIGAFVVAVVWAVGGYFLGPDPPWLWMAGGLPAAGLLAFAVYLLSMPPIKRLTRRWYPEVEHAHHRAEACAAVARRLAADQARREQSKLAQIRDERLAEIRDEKERHLRELVERLAAEREAAGQRWKERVQGIARRYTRESVDVSRRMRAAADRTAADIARELSETESSLRQSRQRRESERREAVGQLDRRLAAGRSRLERRIAATFARLNRRHPGWDEVIAGRTAGHAGLDSEPAAGTPSAERSADGGPSAGAATDRVTPTAPDTVDFLPVGMITADVAGVPYRLPAVLHRRTYSGLIVEADAAQMPTAIDTIHQIIWRMLAAAPPGRCRLTLIDPIGRGQNFTSFMALADYDPAVVGHRVWTTEAQIESRLAEVATHVEDVLQAMLRDRYARVEDYNAVAGLMAEPYRLIAAVGFPEALSRLAYRHLRALIEAGPRCGLLTLLVVDPGQAWPAEMPLPDADRMLRLGIAADGSVRCGVAGLDRFPLRIGELPPPEVRPRLVEQVGLATVAAARVEVPLESLMAEPPGGAASSADGLSIPVGTQGAGRVLSLDLGSGVCQHALVAGKTGSGKSTLLHALITSGAYHYRPDELHFYLLDFKKGVEFKPYAELGLPHARVIGIESEREFGLSVLRRLDQELQRRGEAFRDAGVQSLAAFRAASGKPLPRILLVVDEFQEIFVRDDRLAADAAMLLDRLVRQGRSFGIHVVLSSQSLAGANALPRATLGQMAVRVALQCGESDAALILGDDNTAARLLARPGEAIYNDAGGRIEGNRPFQVAWLPAEKLQERLRMVAGRDAAPAASLAPAIVFEGNRPSRWSPRLAEAVGEGAPGTAVLCGLLGEAVEIGPPVGVRFAADPGRNLVVVAPPESRPPLFASLASSLRARCSELRLIHFGAPRAGEGEDLGEWLAAAHISSERVRPRESAEAMREIDREVSGRAGGGTAQPPILLLIDPLERFRDLRQRDAFAFSLEAADDTDGAAALQRVLRDGPSVNVFTAIACGGAETLSRWLPRGSLHDLEQRVLGRLNAADSSLLIDTAAAAELSAATMLAYDDADGRMVKFRPCGMPDAEAVAGWLRGREDPSV